MADEADERMFFEECVVGDAPQRPGVEYGGFLFAAGCHTKTAGDARKNKSAKYADTNL